MSLLQVLVALSLLGSCLGLGVSFQAGVNVSGSVTANGWQYRQVAVQTFDVPELGEAAAYESLSVGKVPGSISGDLLIGAAYVFTGSHPVAFTAYFSEQVQWTTNVTSGGSAYATTNVTGAAGYVGFAVIALQEIAPNGTVVATQNLKAADIPANGLQYSITSSSQANLKSVSFSSVTSSGFSFDLTFVAASVAGILNQSDIAVGPKSLETIVAIKNYQYQNPANSLALVFVVATGSATVSAAGKSIVTVSNTSQVYFSTNNITDVGTIKPVGISISSNDSSQISEDTYFKQQVTAKYGATASFHVVTVTFPANASTIVYDPSVGAGAPVDDSTADQTTTGTSTNAAGKVALFGIFAVLLSFVILL